MVKGPGFVRGPGEGSIHKAESPAQRGAFQEVLDRKKAQNLKGTRTDQAYSTEAATRERLSELIKGEAPVEDVVQTVVQDNPLFRNLPPDRKEDMIQQVADMMRPLLSKNM